MKKRLILCLCLLALIPALALGAVRMPDKRGSVTDAADVLSHETAADLAAFAQRMQDETGVGLYVAVVHFLDGAEVQSYANALFDLWELGGSDMLLLGAAGEDSFAAALGHDVQKTLGASNAANLLYTSSDFGVLFRAQRYDEAFAACCTALSELLTKQTGAQIRMDGLFGHSAPAAEAPAQPGAVSLWDDVMTAINDSSESYHASQAERQRKDNGITAGGWIVLAVLAVILLRQSKSRRRRGRAGCGCSPLGWIFGLLGINFLVDFFRKD